MKILNAGASGELTTQDGSFIQNCLIKRRVGDPVDALFKIPVEEDRIITKLGGYAIIPIEEYYQLMANDRYSLSA